MPILKYGNPLLRKKVADVTDFNKLPQLIERMFLTIQAEGGIGLAANQVNKSINLLIVDTNNQFFQASEIKKKITEQKIRQMKMDAIKSIKDESAKIAIESVAKLIKTSIDKSKLDNLFKENLNQAKNTLKKTKI